MNRNLLSILSFLVLAGCTQPEQSPDLAGQLVGTYSTRKIDLNWQNYEAGLYSASDGQITMTRAGTSLDQIKLNFSYTVSQEGSKLTKRRTDTETIQLQSSVNQIHFKGVSSTNLGWYLGFWIDQNGSISGRYADKSFTAVKQ